MPAAEALRALGSSEDGLSAEEALRRRRAVGPNVLRVRRDTALGVLARQFRNPLLLLLLAAAIVSGLTSAPLEALIIAAIVLLSVGLGFVSEYRASAAVAALHADIRYLARVARDGATVELPTAELVPGDVVTLRMGDIVPADVRLLDERNMACDESVLTGEPLAAEKTSEPAGPGPDLGLSSCAYMGTVVHSGGGRGVVVRTGSRTAFGAISAGLSEREAETAFQVGLRDFSGLLAKVAGVLTLAIFVVNLAFGRPLLETILFALAIAIGITPQLLPAIVSVSLSSGSRALARRRVLVKRLVTIEDLGNVRTLFTDKTGTLTEGAVALSAALGPDGAPADAPLLLGLVCTDPPGSEAGSASGDALDLALRGAERARPLLDDPGAVPAYRRLGTVPFDHERRLSSVLAEAPGGGRILVTKGAPEAVLERCDAAPAAARETLARLFAAGARVVAVGTRPAGELTAPGPADERGLRLVGFLTFADPPKADAAEAIGRLAGMGVRVAVITGDNPVVAAAVCREIGLEVDGVVSGEDLDPLDDAALAALIPRTTVFGRMGPEQKSRLVKVARRTGADVAFLGDGVNDAVALHAADVGISVDRATDIAKDAADIVLLDKDLGVLADGIAEGRRIFANTLKYVLMATSSNFGNMFSAAGASLFLSFLPMLPSQVLLNNLLYDAGQLAIPTDRVDPETVARPAAWDIAFVRRFMAVFGPLSSVFDFLTFGVMLWVLDASQDEFRTGWFVESLATQTLVIYVIRTRRVPFLRSRPSGPMLALPPACAALGAALPFTPLAGPLGFTTLPLAFFLILVGMILSYLALVEVAKGRFYAWQGHPRRVPPTRGERHARRVHRRVARFSLHVHPRLRHRHPRHRPAAPAPPA